MAKDKKKQEEIEENQEEVEMKETEDLPRSAEEEEKEQEGDEEEEVLSFNEMGIDDRILLAVLKQGWLEPTPIQETAIPLILEGRDILAKARTGSGKTGAYTIPLLHKILSMKKLRASVQATSALVLTPSRELCHQAYTNLSELMVYCQREISIVDLTSSDMTLAAQKQALATKPDIIVATPTKILQHLKDEQQATLLGLKTSLEMLVIDEADLLLSFGYEDDMRTLVK